MNIKQSNVPLVFEVSIRFLRLVLKFVDPGLQQVSLSPFSDPFHFSQT